MSDPAEDQSTPQQIAAPSVVDQSAQARTAGYSWGDINSHLDDKRTQAKAAGYSDEEINKYLGLQSPKEPDQSHPDPSPLQANDNTLPAQIRQFANKYLTPSMEQPGYVEPSAAQIQADGFWKNLGWSALDVAKIFGKPFVNGVADLLDYSAGGLKPGENMSPESVGALMVLSPTSPVGFKAGAAPKEVTPIPKPEEVIDAATAVTGLKGPQAVDNGVGTAMTNLAQHWTKTGEPPLDAAKRAQSDPVFRQQIQAPPPPEVPTGSSATPTVDGAFVIGKMSEENPLPPIEKAPLGDNPNAWEHVASRIADIGEGPTPWEQVKAAGYRTYLDLFNPDHPIRALVDAVEEGKKLPDMENPNYLYRFAELSNTRSQYMVERKMIDIDGNVVGKGLNEILDPLKGKEGDFWTYSVAKWAVEKAEQAKETGVDVDAAKQVVVEGDSRFREAFGSLVDWQNGTLKYARDGGLISKENYDKMVAENQARIPGYRAEEEASDKVRGPGPGKTAFSPVKKFFGSDKKIEPILKSLLQEAFLRVELANRNRANLALADIAEETGLGGKVSNQARPIELTDQELLNLGIQNLEAAREDGAATIFRAFGQHVGADEVPIFRDGKMEVWKFEDPDLTRALRGYDQTSLTTWRKLAAGMTKITRNLIVLNPFFPIRLMDYDIPWQFITKPGLRNTLADFYVGLKNIAGGSKAYDAWMRSGGAERIFDGLTRNSYIKEVLKGHADPAYTDGVWNAIKSPYHALRNWAQLLNQSQRVGRYIRGRQAGESGPKAAAASTDAAFHRAGFGGPAAKSWNSVAPFTAAYLNSLEQTVRGMFGIGKTITGDANSAAQFSAKAAAIITIPMLANWFNGHDKDWYKAAPDWQKDNGLLIHIGPDDGGHTVFFKFPPVLSFLYGALPRRLMEAFVADNPHAWDGIGKSFGSSFAPPGGLLTYNVFLPLLEQLANHSFFRDQPLVPDDLKRNVLTPEQYNNYSSGTAKGLSRFVNDLPLLRNFGLSPPVIDNYIQDWGGTIGTMAVRSADLALGTGPHHAGAPAPHLEDMPGISSFLSRYPSASAAPTRDFETRMDNYNAVHGSLMRAMEAGDLARFQQIVKENPAAAAMHKFQFNQETMAKVPSGQDMMPYTNALQQAAKQINTADAQRVMNAEKALKNMKEYAQSVNSNTKFTPTDKRQLLDQTYSWMQEVSQRGIGSMDRAGLP